MRNMASETKYLSIPKAAKLCGVGRTTMWKWVKNKKLQAIVTPGGHHRILKKDLEGFIRDHLAASSSKPRKEKILLVDDDPQIQKTLIKLLIRQDFRVENASDGFEAGTKISLFKPDLVILDLFMPGIDGFEVCKVIKKNSEYNNVKVLAMTGYDTPENKEKILAAGADGYMSKSSDMDNLVSTIRELL